MSAIGEPTVFSEPSSNMSAIEANNSMDMSEPTEKTKKAMLKTYGYPRTNQVP